MKIFAATVALLAVSALALPSGGAVMSDDGILVSDTAGGSSKGKHSLSVYVKHPDIVAVESLIASQPEEKRLQMLKNQSYKNMLNLQFKWDELMHQQKFSAEAIQRASKKRDEMMAELRQSVEAGKESRPDYNSAQFILRQASISRNYNEMNAKRVEMKKHGESEDAIQQALEPNQARINELDRADPQEPLFNPETLSAYHSLRNYLVHKQRAVEVASCAMILSPAIVAAVMPEYNAARECKLNARKALETFFSKDEIAMLQKLSVKVHHDLMHIQGLDLSRMAKQPSPISFKLTQGSNVKAFGFSLDEQAKIKNSMEEAFAMAERAHTDLTAHGSQLPSFRKYFPLTSIGKVQSIVKSVVDQKNPIYVYPQSKGHVAWATTTSSPFQMIYVNLEALKFSNFSATMFHELTHHHGTKDFTYGARACQSLARLNKSHSPPENNADSYTYFASENWKLAHGESIEGDDGDDAPEHTRPREAKKPPRRKSGDDGDANELERAPSEDFNDY